ncbi:MAG: hypothetical protein HY319_01850 [Armatimonadetes bacterium]|nr:hypothetical protein [Armatimonadota bacterium]
MSVLGGASSWWSRNVGGAADFASQRASRSGAVRAAGLGAGAGAVLGAGLAVYNVSQDRPYFEPVLQQVPRPELGPTPQEVFGPAAGALLDDIRARASDSGSAQSSLQYLAFVGHLSGDSSPQALSSLYNTLENHFSDDAQVRQALNLVAAYVDKFPGTRPARALALLLNEGEDFGRASREFADKYGITDSDLTETRTRMELRHTALLGGFGLVGGVVIGAAAGAVVGAGIGVAVSALVRLATDGGRP